MIRNYKKIRILIFWLALKVGKDKNEEHNQ